MANWTDGPEISNHWGIFKTELAAFLSSLSNQLSSHNSSILAIQNKLQKITLSTREDNSYLLSPYYRFYEADLSGYKTIGVDNVPYGITFFDNEDNVLQGGTRCYLNHSNGDTMYDEYFYTGVRYRGSSNNFPSSDIQYGDIFVNTTDHKLYQYSGSSWDALDNNVTVTTAPATDSVGLLFYGTAPLRVIGYNM